MQQITATDNELEHIQFKKRLKEYEEKLIIQEKMIHEMLELLTDTSDIDIMLSNRNKASQIAKKYLETL